MKSFNDYIVDIDAIRKNFFQYKKIDKKSKICAVVKANGYGIGVDNVVKAIDDVVDFYAVATAKESCVLRKKTNRNILVLNFVPASNINFCIKNNISVSVSNIEQLHLLSLKKQSGKLKIHIAINTGMNRIGFKDKNKFKKALQFLQHSDNIVIEGIFTHFFDAENEAETKKQFCIFNEYLSILKKYFDIDKIIKHCSASVASIKYSDYRLDMVRLGILLYGFCENENLKLENVLSIKSKIICIQNVKKNEKIGYGNTIASVDTKIGIVPIGYADGYFRSIAKNGYVLVNGNFCKIVGKICMDMLMIDLQNTNTQLFDEVVVMGKAKNGCYIFADTVASWSDTICYEVLTNIKKERFNIKIS